MSEVDGFQVVCIDVLSGDVDGREITLDYFTSSGSASMNFCDYTICVLDNFFPTLSTATSDYSPRSGHVTIGDDDTYQCVSIPIINDNSVENVQCFWIEIRLSNTVDNITVNPSVASICIFDRNCK